MHHCLDFCRSSSNTHTARRYRFLLLACDARRFKCSRLAVAWASCRIHIYGLLHALKLTQACPVGEQEAWLRTLELNGRLQRNQRGFAKTIVAVKLKALLAKTSVAIALHSCQYRPHIQARQTHDCGRVKWQTSTIEHSDTYRTTFRCCNAVQADTIATSERSPSSPIEQLISTRVSSIGASCSPWASAATPLQPMPEHPVRLMDFRCGSFGMAAPSAFQPGVPMAGLS